MHKKILIIVGLFVFSAITYVCSYFVFIVSEMNTYVDELVEAEEYDQLNKFIYGNISDLNSVYEYKYEDGTVLNIYKTITTYNELDEETGYYSPEIMTESIQLFFANIGDDFDFSNVGGVNVLNGNVEYIGESQMDQSGPSNYEAFRVFSVYIDTSVLSSEESFDTVVLFDNTDKEDVLYEFDLSNVSISDLKFSSEESTNWSECIRRATAYYNGDFTNDIEGFDDMTNSEQDSIYYEERIAIEKLIYETQEDSDFSISDITGDLLTSRTVFKVKNTFAIIAIIALNAVVVYFSFIKGAKKSSSTPVQKIKKDVIDAK